MVRAVAVLAVAMALSGCVTSPGQYAVERTRAYNEPKSVIWSRLTRYLTDNEMRITTIEKASGTISAEREFYGAETSWWDRGTLADVADCGKDFWLVPAGHTLQINSLVQGDAISSQLTVTVVVRENHLDMAGYGSVPPPTHCSSTGALERDILDDVGLP